MAKEAYNGISNRARKVKEIYIGVNNKARKVKEGYVGVNGKARQFWSGGKTLGTWKTATLPSISYWSGIAYGNNRYVVVGGTTTAYSTNGISWTATSLPSGPNGSLIPWSIAYGNGLFVAPCHEYMQYDDKRNPILYSTTGTSWSVSYVSDMNHFLDITYGDGKFVAVGDYGIIYSTDGKNWSKANAPSKKYTTVAYGNGIFVASPSTYSVDGINWIDTSNSFSSYNILYGNNLFLSLNREISYYGQYSNNGTNWSSVLFNQSLARVAGAFGEGIFITCGIPYLTANGSICEFSTDGLKWTKMTMPLGCWASATYGNNRFVVIAGNADFSGSTSNLVAYIDLI